MTRSTHRLDGNRSTSPAGQATHPPAPVGERPTFGVDAPSMVVLLGGFGAAFGAWAVVIALGSGAMGAVGPAVAGGLCLLAAGAVVRSSRVVKPALWAERLDMLDLAGTERALDVGCGRGLVTIGLAQRLPHGSVVGVDVWHPRHQTGNSRANAERNLRAAGVDGRVELVDAPMVELPFDDGEFDVVTASLSLHHLALASDRGSAMRELMRVTRPGGALVILDVAKTFEYGAWLDDAGWIDVVRERAHYGHYPPVRFVTATKPATVKRPRAAQRAIRSRGR